METNRMLGPRPPRAIYYPGLDGLRAFACLGVMIYHLGSLGGFRLPAGFLGVTVFFTLSGFLITSLLLEELRFAKRIDLRAFWRRRAWRIMPLLWVVSAVWVLWGIIAGTEFGRNSVAGGLTSLFFGTNWLAALRYEGAGILNGNWSVALEEQFYLTWPLLLWLLHRRLRSEQRIALVVFSLAVSVAAYRWAMAPNVEFARVWFGTDAQVDALLAGCLVALGWRCRSNMLSLAAGLALFCLFLLGDADLITMRYLMPATSICTALVIPLLQRRPGPLAWNWVVAVGRRSYGLYLWGGPITWLARHGSGASGLGLWVLVLVTTFAATEVTYRLVEVPLRRRGRRRPVSPSDGAVERTPLAA